MRHAFDADHIAAIDNTTRKLREDRGKQPVSVGFWFSLGHSIVVVVMVALIAFGVRALANEITNENSFISKYAGVFGASVSGVFLLIIRLLNLVVLVASSRSSAGCATASTTRSSWRSSWPSVG